jgi:WD40 repeat protein
MGALQGLLRARNKRAHRKKRAGVCPCFHFFPLFLLNLHFAPADTTFASSSLKSGSADNTVRLWTILPRHTSEQLKGHTAAVVALAVLDEHRLAR